MKKSQKLKILAVILFIVGFIAGYTIGLIVTLEICIQIGERLLHIELDREGYEAIISRYPEIKYLLENAPIHNNTGN